MLRKCVGYCVYSILGKNGCSSCVSTAGLLHPRCISSTGLQDSTTLSPYFFVFIIDAVAFGNAQFGAGAGPIYLDNVACSGSESSLLDCPRRSFVSCYSWNGGAGVRCQG